MQSVTSETASNVPYQSTPPRFTRPAADQPSANDIFGSLVDSNAAADANNSAAQAQSQFQGQQQSAQQNWNNNNSIPAANNNPWQNAAPANQPANNNNNNDDSSGDASNNQNSSAGPASNADGTDQANGNDGPRHAKDKSAGSKDDFRHRARSRHPTAARRRTPLTVQPRVHHRLSPPASCRPQLRSSFL